MSTQRLIVGCATILLLQAAGAFIGTGHLVIGLITAFVGGLVMKVFEVTVEQETAERVELSWLNSWMGGIPRE